MGTVELRRALWLPWALLFLLFTCTFAADKIPDVQRTPFLNPTSNLYYFDDSDCVLITDAVTGEIWRSTDAGTKWDKIHKLGDDKVVSIFMNPWSKKVAVALGRKEEHWITKNRGEDWESFKIVGMPAYRENVPLVSFHADDEDRIILNTRTDRGPQAVYTITGFAEEVQALREEALQCLWAREQEHFTSGDSTIDKDRVLCVVPGRYSKKRDAQRLVFSNNFFKSEGREPDLEDDRPVAGISSIVTAKAFVLAARSSPGTSDMALYVTTDTKKWHRASFGGNRIIQHGYTIMESTNHSLLLDVATSPLGSPPMGTLFTSNSLGYSFVPNEQYTNRDRQGLVDFEQFANIQGIALVNIVDNADDVRDTGAPKKIRSQISFDDGRTFENIKAGDKNLHLHSITEQSNVGRVFSSLAPGIAMGVGNTGDFLKSYDEGDLYVSDDAGRNWERARSGPHKYEFGDQGSVLLAIPDRETDTMCYSINHGKDWKEISFEDYKFSTGGKRDVKVKPITLTTLPDSTSLKFILTAAAGLGSETNYYTYSIDFKSLELPECKESDFEDWYARLNKQGEARCIMGHKQKFSRRKADAKCFIGKKFIDPKSENENCPCYFFDYECNEGYQRSKDRKACEPIEPKQPPSGECKKGDETFEDESGFRLVPGNTCEQTEGKGNDMLKKVQRPCPDSSGGSPPAPDGKITRKTTPFEASTFREFYYLEKAESSEGDDETIILRTDTNEVYITHDHGKKWDKVDIHDEIAAIYPHSYMNDQVYLITPSKTLYYSKDRGKSKFKVVQAPGPPVPGQFRIPILRFHPKNEDWLIWTACEEDTTGSKCSPEAFVSKKNGRDKWTSMLTSVGLCDFVWREDRKEFNASESLTYCMQHEKEDPRAPFRLFSSEDGFETKKQLMRDVIAFVTMSEYIIVASKESRKNNYLKVDASIDGKTFADAKLPASLQVHHTSSYTVLDSSTHSIFLHVTVNSGLDQEYGTIVKSNSNGTSYTMSLSNVNSGHNNFVDFEKLHGLEGVAVANVVDNVKEVLSGQHKKLKTMITHDDGATWSLIKPPKKDAEDRKYACESGKLEKCSLHLHGYSERLDPRITYSSRSAVGLMFGVGNVGDYLKTRREGDTFISRDGGRTWKTAKNGQYKWEYGDRGSIIVIVEENNPTNVVYYSQDEGGTWQEYEFSQEKMVISEITTVPSDTSRNFLLWGKETVSRAKATTVNLDFTGLTSKKCEGLKGEIGKKQSDYYLWEPSHPDDKDNKENCLFGHVSQYIRKKPESVCYNPPNFPDRLYNIKKNCSCTRQDFECDYNYERQPDGTCKLAKGQKPRDGKAMCAKNNNYKWYEPSGYRRLPLSTCQGGRELQYLESKKHSCPGKEDEFNEKEGGLGGVGLFFAIVIPIGAAAAVGWWMWRNLDGRFGRIRLGDASESGPPLSNRGGRGHEVWVKYPVMVASAAVAVVMAVPMLAGVLWRSVREWIPGGRRSYYSTYGRGVGNGRPYTSRDSFARAGRDYSDGPHNDERDLLGEDSDDDI